jgi:hypothetical protein
LTFYSDPALAYCEADSVNVCGLLRKAKLYNLHVY